MSNESNPDTPIQQRQSRADSRMVFKGAHLVDGEHSAQPDMTVVLRGDRIECVCSDAAFEARPGDDIHELNGLTLMPGMVQSHFHSHFGAFGEGVTAPALGLEAAPPYLSMLAAHNAGLALEAGMTSAIGSSNAYGIDVSLKEAMLAGFVKGPRYLAGSRELVTTGEASDFENNRNAFMQIGNTGLTYAVNGQDEWSKAARIEAGRGCDVIKISAGPGHGSSPARDVMYLTPSELRACVDAAHTLGKRVRAHAPTRTSILECARAGVDIIDHADRIDDECIEAILDTGATVVPSMLWSARFLEIAESWDHDASRLAISEGFPETPSAVRERIRQVHEDFDYTCQAIPKAARAGVRMVIGDDFGTPIMPHGDYIPELELYVKLLGIPPIDVLRWATRNGAELMGHGEGAGTIARENLADLLIVEGDPLADITCLADHNNLKGILLGGTWVKNEIEQKQSA
jgi:imidazolonepropionase-like amidohydrolase